MSKSSEEREQLLDRIVERWEELRAAGNELSVDALCEVDEGLRELIKVHPGLIEEAEDEIQKLRRFNHSFGDLLPDREALTDDAALVQLANIDHATDLDSDSDREDQADGLSSSVGEPTQPVPLNDQGRKVSAGALQDANLSNHRVHPGTRLIIDSRLTVETRFDGGGLGDIYRASDESLRRPVVVKLIRDYAKNRHYKRRFIREATVTAQLNGPGVIPIHGYGTAADGQPFYIMRLIDGDGLDEKIKRFHTVRSDTHDRRRNSVEFQRLLRYFLSICRTISYAHDMGVVHCDLKPQNIKIGKYDEVFVLDWGEATSCGSRLDVPRHHSGRISPAYAPPELASASSPPSPATDIYSLGVMLYEVLIGRRAVDDSPSERETNLRSRGVPRALASICAKAMEVKQQARYESVTEMADDIERWMADEAVSVHHYTLGERVAQSLRRYTTITQIGAACITALLLLSAVLGVRLLMINGQQEQRHIQTLKVSAGLSADSIGGEIDRRIMFLESLERELRQQPMLLNNAIDSIAEAREHTNDVGQDSANELDSGAGHDNRSSDSEQDLMSWLNSRLIELDAPQANSWFILDHEGNQIAKRVPPTQEMDSALASLGKNFRYRDYFHGSGVDLSPSEASERAVEPIAEPYLCRRYTSSTTNALRVALTVPLFDQEGTVVGVIGMSFNLDELSFVSHRLNEQESLILIDTRQGADGGSAGVVVVHPEYRTMMLEGYRHEYETISQSLLSDMEQIASRRLVQLEHVGADQRLRSIENYTAYFDDPVIAGSGTIGAAYEPIIIRHRGLLIDTGLVVMVGGQTQ